MIHFFHLKKEYYHLKKRISPPPDLVEKMQTLKDNLRTHYLYRYLCFYDILFVDDNGDIFYTIRKEADYQTNIFNGDMAETALAKHLKKNPDQPFVDYQYYSVSDEPSAFVIIPVEKKGHHSGWFVFQCAINKINNILSNGEELGKTGEVFLVNKNHYMLTDSRFEGESSILKKHLSDKNISAKFKEMRGRKIVLDYRGFYALTSFEVCRIAGSEWLLISKIDEDEIITDHFKTYNHIEKDLIKTYDAENGSEDCPLNTENRKMIRVDMDEFRKAKNKEIIGTFGVSTCTGVIVSLPGKFSYLMHISNLDRIYGGNTTDIIGNVLKRIQTFDIYKFQSRHLQVTIIANHTETLMNIINRLIENGLFLSQIKFMYNGNAAYANLIHDYQTDKTVVKWIMDRNIQSHTIIQCSEKTPPIANLIKPLMGYK